MAQQAIHSKDASPPEEAPVSESGGFHVIFKNPYLFGVALVRERKYLVAVDVL